MRKEASNAIKQPFFIIVIVPAIILIVVFLFATGFIGLNGYFHRLPVGSDTVQVVNLYFYPTTLIVPIDGTSHTLRVIAVVIGERETTKLTFRPDNAHPEIWTKSIYIVFQNRTSGTRSNIKLLTTLYYDTKGWHIGREPDYFLRSPFDPFLGVVRPDERGLVTAASNYIPLRANSTFTRNTSEIKFDLFDFPTPTILRASFGEVRLHHPPPDVISRITRQPVKENLVNVTGNWRLVWNPQGVTASFVTTPPILTDFWTYCPPQHSVPLFTGFTSPTRESRVQSYDVARGSLKLTYAYDAAWYQVTYRDSVFYNFFYCEPYIDR